MGIHITLLICCSGRLKKSSESCCCQALSHMKCSHSQRSATSERHSAWKQRSRHWHTALEEDDTVDVIMKLPEFTYQDLDNVFVEKGGSINMIQHWLQDCRSSVEGAPEDTYLSHIRGTWSKENSTDDDFNLGAEAILLSDHCKFIARMENEKARAKFSHMGNSMASSSTIKTSSSVSEILSLYQEDAETILYNLGFACVDPCAAHTIPTRYFLSPSRAAGIDFKLFLESQMQRIEKENYSYLPSLNIFATSVDSFHSLHSHMMMAPLQNITPAPGIEGLQMLFL
ncbi:protein TESPA1 isoform X2 [Xenopus tropicalis]|uniref:Protein TESPA1 isoform X2 n=1 Tax=Xenopus tropicalis TaxID=8364 RepID=A0A8J1J7Q6_XENTR|nr:protein TESPA1 isoform X2 [Xenopus tropicalis]